MNSVRPLLLPTIAAAVGIMTVALAWLVAERGAKPAIVIQGWAPDATIVVFVEGAVATPGIHSLPADARVQQAITAAGGFTIDADQSRLNLAARVEDEERLLVPSLTNGENAQPAEVAHRAIATSAAATADPVDINRATAVELDRLPGIGPVLAGRIVAYREVHGPYGTIEELARVDGISAAMVDDLRDAVVVGS